MAKKGPRKKAQQVVEGRAGSPVGQGEPPPLDELAEAVASGEAEPGPEMPPEEIAELTPEQVAELTVAPEDQAIAGEEAAAPYVAVASPTGILRQVVLGNMSPTAAVCGAQVSFIHRPTKWRDAEALIVAGVGKAGEVLIDLELLDAERTMVKAVPYGEGVGCWKFRG